MAEQVFRRIVLMPPDSGSDRLRLPGTEVQSNHFSLSGGHSDSRLPLKQQAAPQSRHHTPASPAEGTEPDAEVWSAAERASARNLVEVLSRDMSNTDQVKVPSGRLEPDQGSDRPDSQAIPSGTNSQGGTASPSLPLFTTASQPQQQQHAAVAKDTTTTGAHQNGLPRIKRPREDTAGHVEQQEQAQPQAPAISQFSAPQPLMSHPLGDLVQSISSPGPQPSPSGHITLLQQQETQQLRWSHDAERPATAGAVPQGVVPIATSAGLWALPQASGTSDAAAGTLVHHLLGLPEAAQAAAAARAMMAAPLDTSAAAQQEQPQGHFQQHLPRHFDQALLSQLRLLAPPGAAIQGAPQAPIVPHLAASQLHASVHRPALSSGTANNRSGTMGGGSNGQPPQPRQQHPQPQARVHATPPSAFSPVSPIEGHLTQVPGIVLGPVPGATAAAAHQAAIVPTVSQPGAPRPPSQPGAMPAGADPEQLLSMRLPDQGGAYAAAIAGLHAAHAQQPSLSQNTGCSSGDPLGLADPHARHQQHTQLSAHQLHIEDIRQRAFQAGLQEAQRQAQSLHQLQWGQHLAHTPTSTPPQLMPHLPVPSPNGSLSGAAVDDASAGGLATSQAQQQQQQQQPVTVLSAPVALSLVGQPVHASLPLPAQPTHPSTVLASVPVGSPFPGAQYPHLIQQIVPFPAAVPMQGGATAAATAQAQAALQGVKPATHATSGHPSHTSTSTTESLMQSDAILLSVTGAPTSASVPFSYATAHTPAGDPQTTPTSQQAQCTNNHNLQHVAASAAPSNAAAGQAAAPSPSAAAAPPPSATGGPGAGNSQPPPASLEAGAAQHPTGVAGGIMQAVQELAVTAPSTASEVAVFQALQEQLDVVQQRLSTEQTHWVEKLDTLLQNMLKDTDATDPQAKRYMVEVQNAMLKSTTITKRLMEMADVNGTPANANAAVAAVVAGPSAPQPDAAAPPPPAAAPTPPIRPGLGLASLAQQPPAMPTQSLQQPYTSERIRAAANAAAAAVDPEIAYDALARGEHPAAMRRQELVVPAASAQPLASRIAVSRSAANTPALEAESAAAVQQAGLRMASMPVSTNASIAQAGTVAGAATENGGSMPAAGEEDPQQAAAGTSAAAAGSHANPAPRTGVSDNAADSGSATSLPQQPHPGPSVDGAGAQTAHAGPAGSAPADAPSVSGCGATTMGRMSESMDPSDGRISKQASYEVGPSVGLSELPTATNASAAPVGVQSLDAPGAPMQEQPENAQNGGVEAPVPASQAGGAVHVEASGVGQILESVPGASGTAELPPRDGGVGDTPAPAPTTAAPEALYRGPTEGAACDEAAADRQ